jgi:hypothetical protein
VPLSLQIELTDEQIRSIALVTAQMLGKVSENPMTIAQFAAAIGKSKGFVRKRVEAGIILKSSQPGEILIPHSELERYRNGGVPPKKA